MNPFVQAHLDPIARNSLRARFWREVALIWAVLTCLICVAYLLGKNAAWDFHFSRATLFIMGTIGFVTALVRNRLRKVDYKKHAREVEEENEQLNIALLTAIEQEPDLKSGRYSYMQQRVLDFVLAHGRLHFWGQNSVARLVGVHTVHLASLVCLVLTSFYLLPLKPAPILEARAIDGVEITPGNAELEKGKTLVVMAKFMADKAPANALLEVAYEDGRKEQFPMQRGLDDPIFGASLKAVEQNLTYRVAYSDTSSPEFSIEVFEFPALIKADASLDYPDYTGLTDKTIPDSRTISAVEGTILTLDFEFNKALRAAKLTGRNGDEITLNSIPGRPNHFTSTFPLSQPGRFKSYELQLEDAEGRRNKASEKLVLNVTPNLKPKITLKSPRGDQRVSALEEVSFEYEVTDDFGVLASGLSYTIADEPESVLEGTAASQPEEVLKGRITLKLEDLAARPDQLITWNLWSIDIGPDGLSRTNVTDLYFAEIQPFEEIFREGNGASPDQQQRQQQQAEGQQPGGAGELADLQKQIISANWNLRRDKPDTFLEDLQVVIESQEQALTQLEGLKQRAAQDPQSAHSIETAEAGMNESRDAMKTGLSEESTLPLGNAISASRKAYQALLELAQNEYAVNNQNQQSGGGGGGGRTRLFDQQLSELDLSEERDRYVREDAPTLADQSRDAGALTDKLSQIAQRQKDLVDKLRELQAALNAADSPEEKSEIERQLKRLRDEQRRILEDIDQTRSEVTNRSNIENRRGMEQQLDEARENAGETSDRLEKGDVPGAIASGARVQEELDTMSNQLRNQSSSRFAEAMRELRDQSRNLLEQADQAGEDMSRLAEESRNALSDTPEMERLRSRINDNMERQKVDLSELLDSVREIIESSEPTEPLLANRLYETIRSSDPDQMQEALKESQTWLQRNLLTQAEEFNRIAGRGIENLQAGIENAARGILGDDVEALKQARRQVSSLMESLAEETREGMARQNPDSSPDPAEGREEAPGLADQGDGRDRAPSDDSEATRSGQGSALAQGPGASRENNPDSNPGEAGGQPSNPQGASQQDSNGGGGGGNGDPQAQGGRLSDLASSFLDALRNQARQNKGGGGPITGTDFTGWADQWNEVRQMIDMPDLQNEAARIGELVRALRSDFRRDGKEPRWDLVQLNIIDPMDQLEKALSQEIIRRESPESLVPIDRDPVPSEYRNLVQDYYKRLGGN